MDLYLAQTYAFFGIALGTALGCLVYGLAERFGLTR